MYDDIIWIYSFSGTYLLPTHNTMLNVDVASVVHAMVMVKITAKVQIGISLWPGIDILHD